MPDKAVLDSLNSCVAKIAGDRWELVQMLEQLKADGASQEMGDFDSLVDRLSETIYRLYGSIDKMSEESGFPKYERGEIPVRDRKYMK